MHNATVLHKDAMKNKLKRESSKTLLWVIFSGLGAVTVSAIVASFLLHDTSPLITLIECLTKLASIAVGFYSWKAKNENLHKYKQDDKINYNEEQGDYYEK